MGLTKLGSGTLLLSATGGDTQWRNDGDRRHLQMGASNALGTGGLTVDGGTVDLQAQSVTVPGTLDLVSGSIIGGAGVLNAPSYAVQSGTIGPFDGSSSNLTKSGTGTVTLSGDNTYGGSTTVNGGVLEVATTAACPAGMRRARP